MSKFGPLVSTDWLAEHLDAPTVKIIDGSWRMPGASAAIEDYDRAHIPGAAFFDLDQIADTNTKLPHMLPPQKVFEQAVGGMGITNDDDVIIYDEKGIFSAARVWWTFRAMGHERVAVLDGGLPKWRAESRPVTADKPQPLSVTYAAAPDPALCRSANDVRKTLASKDCDIIDARPATRFAGEAPEPRAGLRSGHMPGSFNVPFPALMTEAGTLRRTAEIRRIFSDAGVDLSRPIITSCGSGVTAAVLSLALDVTGCNQHGLYDGSWAEWGDEDNDEAAFPVEGAIGKPG